MLSPHEIEQIINRIKYKDWFIYFNGKEGTYDNSHTGLLSFKADKNLPIRDYYIQVHFFDIDKSKNQADGEGVPELQKCRKWRISPHMTETEIVRTAFKAIEAAVIHETQEDFTYRGLAVYNPHFDINVFLEAADENRLALRD